jgi:5'-nucleotidase (lipoprotein e(P4) family)
MKCARTVSLVLALVLLSIMAAPAPCAEGSQSGTAGTPPVRGSLTANIYNQTAAEYRACCRTIYTAAGYRLEELMEEADPPPVRPAVVMDLDETVLDISSFQTFLYENGLSYTSELWSIYEREGVEEVLLVPGAGEFIRSAEALGVSVVYLSNRNRANQKYTIATLERLGLDTDGIVDRLYLRPDGASSDKSPRRDAIVARHNVLMIFGDNLRDFSEVFAPVRLAGDATTEDYLRAIGARDAAVDAAACHWGVDWFVLPNCMYGEWEKLVPPDPVDIMRPTNMARDIVE